MSHVGRAVLLNGASSAGKTTIAQRFSEARAAQGDCWILVAIDDFNAKLPWQWFDIVKVQGPFGRDGVRFEPSSEGMVVRVGEVGRRLFSVYRRTVATWVRGGFNVLVDEVAFDEEAVRDWHDALAGLPVTWVGVRCAPDVAEARERSRGDRVVGLARGLSAVVHNHVVYDFELDTSSASPEVLAAQLASFVLAPTPNDRLASPS